MGGSCRALVVAASGAVACIGAGGSASAAVVFAQDFSGSSSVASYVGSPPSAGQFDQIAVSGAGTTVSITSGALQYARSGNIGSYTRSTDFSPVPGALLHQMDLAISGNVNPQTQAATWYLGEGFVTGNTAPADASVAARVAVNFTNTAGQFTLRHLDADDTGPDLSVNSNVFVGVQTIRWYVNGTGSAISYAAPDGSGAATLGAGRYDLWVGTTRAFDEKLMRTSGVALSDMKFVFAAGGGTIRIDNLSVTSLPDPSAPAAASVALTMLARRRRG